MSERTGIVIGQGGVKLHYKVWEPAEVKGSIVLVHGAGEHIGRYEHVASHFTDRGFAVCAMDQRGHGRSEGLRCHVDRFDDYLADLRQFVGQVTDWFGPPVLIGHSMGGLVSYRYALAHPAALRALVLSSPWFGLKMKIDPLQKALAPLVVKVLPRLAVPSKIRPEDVSRSPQVAQGYGSDPLVANRATLRWFLECSGTAEACHQGPSLPAELPVLVLQAGDDRIVDPAATRAVFQRIGHDRKAFKLYPGKYHEIFNDPGYEEVFTDIVAWLEGQGIE